MGIYAKVNGEWKSVDGGANNLGGNVYSPQWAKIESIEGFSAKVEQNDYTHYIFTDDGSFVVSEPGLIECVLVGPGANGNRAQAGAIADGFYYMPADTLGVEVGRYNSNASGYPNAAGSPTRIFTGTPFTYSSSNSAWHDPSNDSVPLVYAQPGITSANQTYPDWGSAAGRTDWRKDSTWATADIGGYWKGYESDWTGEIKNYAEGNINVPEANSGSSGNNGTNNSAFGIAMFRVPTGNAPATAREISSSWTYLAEVEDGKVAGVTRTKSSTFTTSENVVECPMGVGEGWTYENGEFIAPPQRTVEDQIAELQAQIDSLRK